MRDLNKIEILGVLVLRVKNGVGKYEDGKEASFLLHRRNCNFTNRGEGACGSDTLICCVVS